MKTTRPASLRILVAAMVAVTLVGAPVGGAVLAADGPGAVDVAVLFVGHGEPETLAQGDVPISFADGSVLGPHAEDLGVAPDRQSTGWAAAYEEVATAMTYIFGDLNHNDVPHELRISPAGDVPSFFTYDAFHGQVSTSYEAIGDHSPHNDLLREHVDSVELEVDGARIDRYLAFLDATPRIHDVALELAPADYDKLVVVPLLLASSTHTQEIEAQIERAAALMGDVDVVITEPFFEIPFMRDRIKGALQSMARELRQAMPASLSDDEIGVVLVSYGTPYTPAHAAFGWQEGEIYSDLVLTEDRFHREIAAELPWVTRTGRMDFTPPTIEDALMALYEEGVTHVMMLPSAFPTAVVHTMWDIADASIGRAVTPDEGIVAEEHFTGMMVYLTAMGYADLETGRELFRDGLGFVAEVGVREAMRPIVRDGAPG